MLPKDLPQLHKRPELVLRSLFIIFLSLMSGVVFAEVTVPIPANASSVNAQTMLQNIATQIPNLMSLVTAIAYVLGMIMIIHGVIQLKHAGESRTMMSREHSLTGPIIYIVTGTALLYIPSAVSVGTSTFWGESNPMAPATPQDQFGDFMKIVYLIVQFIGTIAFIRGMVILSHLGGQGGQQGALSKGILHIIGGIFCINIAQFTQVIMATLGIEAA